jgi:hypothetical protein
MRTRFKTFSCQKNNLGHRMLVPWLVRSGWIFRQNILFENPCRKYLTKNPPDHSVSNESTGVTTADQLSNPRRFMTPDNEVSIRSMDDWM